MHANPRLLPGLCRLCLSFTSISRRSLKTKRWNKQYKLISMFARICIDRTFVQRLVRELWRDLLTLIAVAGDLDFSEDKTAHTWLPGSL